MAEIRIETKDAVYEPQTFPIRIGRAVDNDIMIRAVGVSDYHAIIENGAEGLEIRNLHEAHINGKKIRSRALLRENSFLTLGTATLRLWLNPKAKMPNPARAAKWKIFTHPVMAIMWFILAIALPLWTDFLQTDVRYVLNWRLIFFSVLFILGLVWIIHSMLLPVARRYLVIPIVGIVSALSFLSDLSDQAAYWFDFQYSFGWTDTLFLILVAAIFLYVFRAFLRDFIPLGGRLLNRCTIAVALPCLLLLLYSYLQSNNFFSQRPGSFPSYHRGLLKNIAPLTTPKSIDAFLSVEKTNQKKENN
ncbi:FHA domain-containing protein [Suttonella ornithocola]|nr:FHA domain-containing protein [Suttonella ornithocola]